MTPTQWHPVMPLQWESGSIERPAYHNATRAEHQQALDSQTSRTFPCKKHDSSFHHQKGMLFPSTEASLYTHTDRPERGGD